MIEQAPSTRPVTPEEAAFAAELSRSNTFTESFAKAKEFEQVIREFDQRNFDKKEINDHNLQLLREQLDPEYGYLRENVKVTGWVRKISFDHQMVNLPVTGEGADGAEVEEKDDISRSATTREKIRAEGAIATSLGFFALRRSEIVDIEEDPSIIDDDPFDIYLVAKTPLTKVAYHDWYGDMYVSHRLIIPIDGSVDVELADKKPAPNLDLLEIYFEESFLDNIKNKIRDAETLTDAFRALAQIDLSPYDYIFNSKKKVDGGDVAVALGKLIEREVGESLDINFKNYNLFEFTGATDIQYHDADKNEFIAATVDENARYVGDVHWVSVSPAAGRFTLIGIMDLSNGVRRQVIFPITDKLSVTPLQKIPIPEPGQS